MGRKQPENLPIPLREIPMTAAQGHGHILEFFTLWKNSQLIVQPESAIDCAVNSRVAKLVEGCEI